jgi:hypothetical protein
MINKSIGYYTCNGKEFRSKIDALLQSKISGMPVTWNFNDEIYSNYPWHIEPDQSMDYYYDKRARELREKYDYIILSYSGGSDSHNMLESFIRQKLHIDEIITNHISLGSKQLIVENTSIKQSWNFGAEHELQAMPRLKEIHNRIPLTKITVLDVSELILNSIIKDAEWVLGKNDHLSPGHIFRYNYFYFKELKKNFDRNLKIGMILGVDKPKLYIKNDDFYINFSDKVANVITVNEHNTDYTNLSVDMFYWSPETAPMICKQAHVVKKWLEQNPDKQQYWAGINFKVARLYQERFLKPLLYSTWNNNWFQVDKSTDWWYCQFDTWFRTNPEFATHYQSWERGVNLITKTLNDHIIFNSETNLPDSFKVFSKEYYIGKINQYPNNI